MVLFSVDLDALDLKPVSKEFGAENVTVTVEWTQQAAVMYTPRIVPLAPNMSFPISSSSSSQRVQLILSYNIHYNLSVEASAPCRPNTTGFIKLYYGEETIIIRFIF